MDAVNAGTVRERLSVGFIPQVAKLFDLYGLSESIARSEGNLIEHSHDVDPIESSE